MKKLLLQLCLFLPFVVSAQRTDIVVADFESPTYGEWKTTGDAFGSGPAQGTLPGQMKVDGFQGHGLVNTYLGGDDTTGTLTSPTFKIERKYLDFLIGGGGFPGRTCMNLLIAGKTVRTATGPNTQGGGSEHLDGQSWDVSEFEGRDAIIQIVDQATGGWGHINVDQIVLTDRKRHGFVAAPTRQFKISRHYLNFPIKTGAAKRKVTLIVQGGETVVNDIELADGKPDWWASVDVESQRGKTVTVVVDRLPDESTALSSVEQSNKPIGSEHVYLEPKRGQFHFSSRVGWNNDPNGLAFYLGEYHLFYQHNPYGWAWGNMHWGHAVSPDLVHWRELGDTLFPDKFGPMFSGSAVVDWNNTSGFGKPGKPPLVLFYTAAGDPTVQCLANSTDGRMFTKFSGNPIVPQISGGNRDPKVFWHEPSHKWIMCLYVELKNVHTIHFLSSPNLKEWTVMSHTDGFFECPDFFELPVDGGERKWVLTAASSEYEVGTFDGTRFTAETPKLPGHRGRGFYAAQTYSDLPGNDGRRIQIGWFQTETSDMPFNQSMTIPLELKLTSTPEGPRLTWTPVKELESLRMKTRSLGPVTVAADSANPLAGINSELVELRAEFSPSQGVTTFSIRGADISYDGTKQELNVNGHRVPARMKNGKQSLTIFCDRTALEVFASDGLTYVPMPFIPKSDNLSLELKSTGGTSQFNRLDVYTLKSAWK